MEGGSRAELPTGPGPEEGGPRAKLQAEASRELLFDTSYLDNDIRMLDDLRLPDQASVGLRESLEAAKGMGIEGTPLQTLAHLGVVTDSAPAVAFNLPPEEPPTISDNKPTLFSNENRGWAIITFA